MYEVFSATVNLVSPWAYEIADVAWYRNCACNTYRWRYHQIPAPFKYANTLERVPDCCSKFSTGNIAKHVILMRLAQQRLSQTHCILHVGICRELFRLSQEVALETLSLLTLPWFCL